MTAKALVDLHVHSHISDGSDSINELLHKAHEKRIQTLSIVDHDTTASYSLAQEKAQELNINLIPGIEISSFDFKRNRKVHVLGYNYQLDAPHIRAITQPLQEKRNAHSIKQIEALQSAGINIQLEEVNNIAQDSTVIYKQHIMDAITDFDYNSTEYKQLYRRLFKNDGPAAGDIEYIDYKDAIRAIKQDQGVAVIAHPGQLDSYDAIEEAIALGLDGVELYHPDHTLADIKKVLSIAERHNLLLTGGSDYHGSYGERVNMGLYEHLLNLNLSDETLISKVKEN